MVLKDTITAATDGSVSMRAGCREFAKSEKRMPFIYYQKNKGLYQEERGSALLLPKAKYAAVPPLR